MMKKVINKLKKEAAALMETFLTVVGALIVSYLARPIPVHAVLLSYTAPLDNLKTVLLTIAGSAGVIIIVYGGIRFAIAFQKLDQNGEHSAIYTIIAGGVLLGMSVILGVMGV